MIDFCSFNVRGLINKCAFIKDFIDHNKISLIGITEIRVQKDVAKKISSEIAPNFSWYFNYEYLQGGVFGWVGIQLFGK